MANKQTPIVRPFLDANGDPYSGALLFAYTANSATKVTVYQDEAGNTAHANPVVLNSRGEIANGSGATKLIWQPEGTTLDFVLAPSTDSDPPVSAIDTLEDISGINDTTVTIDQWVSGNTPTYVDATSFTLVGDQTTNFHVGRRIKTTNSGGTIYSTISISAYTSLTTITVVNDSGTLDSGLSAVSYALITQTNKSLPLDATTVYRGTAGGTADALTASLTPKLHLLNDKTEARVKSASANATTTPTFNPDSLGAKTITKNGNQALDIGDIPRAGYEMILRRNTSNDVWELLNPAGESEIQSITGTTASSALTLGLKADILDFRSATATNGITNSRAFADLSLVVPSGAKLGSFDGVESDLILFAIDNAGTIELALGNKDGGHDLSEESLISTTTIGTGSDSVGVIYSTTGRSNVPFRVVGLITSTQSTAGTWDTNPSNLQGGGGRAIAGGAANGTSLVWLVTKTASASASLDFDTNIDSTYSKYVFELEDIAVATDDQGLTVETSIDGGSSYASTNYHNASQAVYAGGTSSAINTITGAHINLCGLTVGIGNATGEAYQGTVILRNPSGTTVNKMINYISDYSSSDTNSSAVHVTGTGMRDDVTAIDAIRFIVTSGNIVSGTIRMYGIKKS